MKKSKFSDEQITYALRQVDSGTSSEKSSEKNSEASEATDAGYLDTRAFPGEHASRLSAGQILLSGLQTQHQG